MILWHNYSDYFLGGETCLSEYDLLINQLVTKPANLMTVRTEPSNRDDLNYLNGFWNFCFFPYVEAYG